MHKTIIGFYLLVLASISSCGIRKNASAQAIQAEFKESSFSYTIPGEATALIAQKFKIKLLEPAAGLNLDSLVLVDGTVRLEKQGQLPVWQGFMQWNYKGEGQLQAGDSATVFGHRADILLVQKVQLSQSEDLYLPAEAPQ